MEVIFYFHQGIKFPWLVEGRFFLKKKMDKFNASQSSSSSFSNNGLCCNYASPWTSFVCFFKEILFYWQLAMFSAIRLSEIAYWQTIHIPTTLNCTFHSIFISKLSNHMKIIHLTFSIISRCLKRSTKKNHRQFQGSQDWLFSSHPHRFH